jgi:hypothetical protein
MDKLTQTDQRKISSLARELYCLSSIEALSAHIVRRLHTLIEGNSVLVALEDIKTGMPSVLADNLGPDFQKLGPAMSALHHEHPGIDIIAHILVGERWPSQICCRYINGERLHYLTRSVHN